MFALHGYLFLIYVFSLTGSMQAFHLHINRWRQLWYRSYLHDIGSVAVSVIYIKISILILGAKYRSSYDIEVSEY